MKKRLSQAAGVLIWFMIVAGCTVGNKGTAPTASVDSGTVFLEEFSEFEDTALDEAEVEEETVIDSPDNWFTVSEITDEILARIDGKSYKKNAKIPLEDLRYLTVAHYTFDNEVKKGELICNRLIADDLIDIFRNLYNAHYPIESIRLIDEFDADDRKSMNANNTSCFNYRLVSGTKKLSNHARGLAIDLNPFINPYVVKRKDGSLYVSPADARKYADRTADFPGKVDENDLAYKEFIRHGFEWGGGWKKEKDYQHFQKKFPNLPY